MRAPNKTIPAPGPHPNARHPGPARCSLLEPTRLALLAAAPKFVFFFFTWFPPRSHLPAGHISKCTCGCQEQHIWLPLAGSVRGFLAKKKLFTALIESRGRGTARGCAPPAGAWLCPALMEGWRHQVPPRSRPGASHRASLPAPSWDLHRNPKDLTFEP